ncbi:hypothetical protein EVAR_92818_1 [Eumeta japonica]|uniref:Uncharacterized protein n=1 Tax=Eumeta variegata TaxID=151549 RepID=A0A4C1TAT5_EUMVA|nr:hypothetical protein EVAR_92818_1 [Eumeta japonica]
MLCQKPLNSSHVGRVRPLSLLLGRIGRWSAREIARSALSLARSAQAERDNESCFFVHAAGVHRLKDVITSKVLKEDHYKMTLIPGHAILNIKEESTNLKPRNVNLFPEPSEEEITMREKLSLGSKESPAS